MHRSDHKLMIHRIPTNTSQKKHWIELQELQGEHCIEEHRERRSHLATNYGPVGLLLLTHHRKGSKGDVEPLRDQFPLRGSAGGGLQMGSHDNRNLRRRKKYFGWLYGVRGIFENL